MRLLHELSHTTYDRFGDAEIKVYQEGEVVNFPYHLARAFIRKGLAELC